MRGELYFLHSFKKSCRKLHVFEAINEDSKSFEAVFKNDRHGESSLSFDF